jgi:Lrp/AsnC family transcriptional regulator, leucine-responsive regulatory protein
LKSVGVIQRSPRQAALSPSRCSAARPPAVAERVRRLEQAGVITGYHAHLDLAKAGWTVRATIRMSCYGARCMLRDPAVPGWPEVQEIHRVTGDAGRPRRVGGAASGGHRPDRPHR